MNNITQVVLFADISGSSTLYKQKGNEQAKEMIDRAISEMITLSSKNSGQLIKTIGDEIMVCFKSPVDAYNAAHSIQFFFNGKELSIRIGMAYGETMMDANDVFGDTVNDAAYIAKIAKGKQVLMNRLLFESLPKYLSSKCIVFDNVRIKGENQTSSIFMLDWESESSVTQMFYAPSTDDQSFSPKLNITVNNREISILPQQTPFRIGRASSGEMDLKIDSRHASRAHCDIVFKNGKYVIMDHSTNGTYVKEAGGLPVYLRREECPLTGNGIFSLGEPIEVSSTHISYTL